MSEVCYKEFIDNILNTRGRFNCGDEYHETHHIVPKCLGGTNEKENLIDLFAREHFIAHKLLSIENPGNDDLVCAWWMMAHIDNREITVEEYEEVKTKFAKIASLRMKGENHPNYGKAPWNKGLPAWNRGRNFSEETREKMRKAKEGKYNGEKNPMYGKPSPNKGRQTSEETRRKMSQSAKTRYENLEEREKISGANNPRARKVIRLFDLKIYNYLIEATRDNNMCVSTMRKLCKEHNRFMYYDEWLAQQNDFKQTEEYNGF